MQVAGAGVICVWAFARRLRRICHAWTHEAAGEAPPCASTRAASARDVDCQQGALAGERCPGIWVAAWCRSRRQADAAACAAATSYAAATATIVCRTNTA